MTAGPLILTVFVSYVGECPCFQEVLGLMGTRLAGGGGKAGERLSDCNCSFSVGLWRLVKIEQKN